MPKTPQSRTRVSSLTHRRLSAHMTSRQCFLLLSLDYNLQKQTENSPSSLKLLPVGTRVAWLACWPRLCAVVALACQLLGVTAHPCDGNTEFITADTSKQSLGLKWFMYRKPFFFFRSIFTCMKNPNQSFKSLTFLVSQSLKWNTLLFHVKMHTRKESSFH